MLPACLPFITHYLVCHPAAATATVSHHARCRTDNFWFIVLLRFTATSTTFLPLPPPPLTSAPHTTTATAVRHHHRPFHLRRLLQQQRQRFCLPYRLYYHATVLYTPACCLHNTTLLFFSFVLPTPFRYRFFTYLGFVTVTDPRENLPAVPVYYHHQLPYFPFPFPVYLLMDHITHRSLHLQVLLPLPVSYTTHSSIPFCYSGTPPNL